MHNGTCSSEEFLGSQLHKKFLSLFCLGLLVAVSGTTLAAQQQANPPAAATLNGNVTDATGAMLPGAKVALEDVDTHKVLTDITDGAGEFNFTPIPPGTYTITVTCTRFITTVKSDILLHAGDYRELPSTVLQPVSNDATIIVHADNYELAQQQLQVELHQRVLGILPNFYVTYDPNPVPLTSKQKFVLAYRATFDYTTFVTRGFMAGIEQADDTFPGYGQGMQGYGKRYGSALANDVLGNMFAYAIFPSIFHQDPRYLYQGTGSVHGRLGHALASPLWCRGDNGHGQFNISNVLGTVTASAISNVYYASSDRKGYQLTVDNTVIGLAADAASSIFQEFFLKKLQNLTHKKKQEDQ